MGAGSPAPTRYTVEWMAARGWRLLPVRPRGKEPLTAHGVRDATTDMAVISGWLRRWPNMNIAVACGAPGPQVLDIDDVRAVPSKVLTHAHAAPRVATPRGGHSYFAGTDQATIKLEFGELRGCGSYVLVPPSIHPSGKEYIWLSQPQGPLPRVPAMLAGAGRKAGCGEHAPPPRPIVAGDGRWPYLSDFAVRLARAGVGDERRVLAHLRLEFALSCEQQPPAEPGKLESLAKWAVNTRIAERERACAELTELIRNRNREARR